MASFSPPVGRRGRGPFRSGVHAEMIIAAWRVVDAEVAATVGADVVASAGEPLGASYPAALGGSSYLQGRNGTRAPLENRCNTFAFCKVLKSTIC
jgi:hypothetical protein